MTTAIVTPAITTTYATTVSTGGPDEEEGAGEEEGPSVNVIVSFAGPPSTVTAPAL